MELTEGEEIAETLPADPDVKNYSYTIVDGEVYFRENSVMMRPKLNRTAQERVKSMVALRDTVYRLMNAQLEDADDETIENEQRELNRQYDAFSAKFGLINDRANRLAFSDDSSYYLLSSLEVLDEDRKLERKADMFTKRTIRRPQAITHTDTAAEALAVSIGEKARVDLPYMAELIGKNEDAITKELTGVIYLDPESQTWQTADEYLSGNVREKLRTAQAAAKENMVFMPNVDALQAVQPKDLDASEIDVRLGATWISPKDIDAFMYELFSTQEYMKRYIQVNFSQFNLKQMAQTLNYLSENNLMNIEDLTAKTDAAIARVHEMQVTIRETEKRMAELHALKGHIINYVKTREVYAAYRMAGYSKKFVAEHEQEIKLHQAAKEAFSVLGTQKIPKVKEIQAEYDAQREKKKQAYATYHQAQDEMRQLLTVRANVERILGIEEKEKERQKEKKKER